MIYTVYIDVVFAVNTIMDMVVLTILNRILSYRTTKMRLLAGAMIGGAWSCVVSVIPGLPPVLEMLGTYVAASSLMAVAAYHVKSFKDVVKSVAGIYLVSVVLGGIMLSIYEHTRAGYYANRVLDGGRIWGIPTLAWLFMAAGGAAACYGFSGGLKSLIKSVSKRRDLCAVTLKYGEREETVTGLIDTGNRLREPVTGQPVHVASEEFMRRLCPVVKGVLYIPYQSVGTQNGMLPAVFLDQMQIEQEGRMYCIRKPLVAIASQSLSPSGEYQMLIQKTDEGT